jgi:hypothetical protein
MESNPSLLAFRLRELRRLNSEHKHFIPQLSLCKVMSRDVIRKVLQDTGTEPYNLDEMADYISINSIKIFAILVLIGQAAFASSFVEAELSDRQLPLSSDTLRDQLSLRFFNDFHEMQWEFTAPIFHCSTINRTFNPMTILPIIKNMAIGQTAFTNMYEIKLDSCHQQLEGPFQHRV